MPDPRLNSVHLEISRREDYRRAREDLLQARGMQTVALEGYEGHEAAGGPLTFIEKPEQPPTEVEFWLSDPTGVYPLRVGINTLGRAQDNDVVLQNAFVSRRHCAILVHANEGCDLHDTASKNGTFINGQKVVRPTRLKPGDEIRMCDLIMTFGARSASAPEGPTPTPPWSTTTLPDLSGRRG